MTIEAQKLLPLYLHLAWASGKRQRLLVRDKLLIVAGSLAVEADLEPIADYCRHLVLAHNPGHLVGRQATLAAGLEEPQFEHLVKRLRHRYSPERVEHMLNSLGMNLGREREAYLSDFEYAAALLGTTPDAIDRVLGRSTAAPAGPARPALETSPRKSTSLDSPADSSGRLSVGGGAARLAIALVVVVVAALSAVAIVWRFFN